MKKTILLSVVIIVLAGCATMVGPEASPELKEMTSIVDAEGVEKTELYIKVNEWFVKTFSNAESVIEFQDKEAGKIMGKYTFEYSEGVYFYRVKQTISVDIKDYKIKVNISDPYYAVRSASEPYSGNYFILKTEKGVENARKEWVKLIEDLQIYLNKNDSNW